MDCIWTFEQSIALPDERIFASVSRLGAWQSVGSDGWSCPRALGFVCPTCCKVWGILSREDQELYFVTSNCRRHAKSSGETRVDGSLLYDYSMVSYGSFDVPLLDALPRALLLRELELHMNHIERNL